MAEAAMTLSVWVLTPWNHTDGPAVVIGLDRSLRLGGT